MFPKVRTLLLIGALLVVSSDAIGKAPRSYNKCVSCHSLVKKKMGPPLGSIFGREAGTQKGYRYSKAMRRSKVIWNEDTLDKFLKSPTKYIKGTKMRFRGVKKERLRKSIISYLKKVKEDK